MTLTVFGDSTSGNCRKVKWTLDLLGVTHDWREVEVMSGWTRSPEFLSLNPSGQVPAVRFADGRVLSQSGAILLHFAEGSRLVPADAFERARMLEWMFWEQYSHEPYIAVRRFRVVYQGRGEADLDPILLERGTAALERMELALDGRAWFAGEGLSLADFALVAYTRMARTGGFDLDRYPRVMGWIARTEDALGIGAF